MNREVDYYRVLDIPKTATLQEIKAGYRKAAKAAHPDAGGTAQAMELVNEAYDVLSSHSARHDYDILRTSPPPSPPRPAYRPAPAPATAPRPVAPAARAPRRPVTHPRHISLAQLSALRIIGYNALAAFLLGLVTAYMAAVVTDVPSQIILALVAYIPVYNLSVGVVFLFKPNLRIALHLIGQGHLPPGRDLLSLLLIGVLAVPLALVWLLGYFHGFFR